MSHNPSPETTIDSVAFYNDTDPQIVTLANGGWVVTWTGENGVDDRSYFGVHQQVYNADGTTAGGETLVNTTTAGTQYAPEIAALPDGGWVVAWMSDPSYPNIYASAIYLQAYNADGTTRGAEMLVDSFAGASYNSGLLLSGIAAFDGGWVVNWRSPQSYSTYEQAYNADGTTLVGKTQLNTELELIKDSKVATLADGGWIVTWVKSDAFGVDIYQQVHNADGTAEISEALVTTNPDTGLGDLDVTGLKDGGWVITWTLKDGYTSISSVHQQVYQADGTPLGEDVQVNTFAYGFQSDPRVAALSDGGWVVTWTSEGQDGDGQGVYQQAYNADGTARGVETQVNTFTQNNQSSQQVTALADGGWVVSWTSDGQDGSGLGVYHQAYSADGTPLGVETRADANVNADQFHQHVIAMPDGGWLATWASTDNNGATVLQRFDAEGQVYGSNHAPTAADATVPMLEDESHTFTRADFGFSDGTDGDSLSAVVVTALPAQGTLTLNGVAVEAGDSIDPSFIATGWLVYTPAENAHGLASLTFEVVDDGGTAERGFDTSASHTITFDIVSVNDAPTAEDATLTAVEDTPYTFSISDFGFADAADGDSLSAVKITSLPAQGTLTLNGVSVNVLQLIDASDIDAGELIYTPIHNANGSGLTSLTFQVVDDGDTLNGGVNMSVSPRTITFDVTAVNDAPTRAITALTADEGADSTISGTELRFDDIDNAAADIVYTLDTVTAHGTLWFDANHDGVKDSGEALAAGGSFTQADVNDGWLHYLHDGSETTSDSFTFDVSDGAGGEVADQSLAITVTPVNDVPVSSGTRMLSGREGTYTAITTAQLNVTDPDNTASELTYTLNSSSSSVRLWLDSDGDGAADTLLDTGSTFTQQQVNDGRLFVTGDDGPNAASFSFSVSDGAGGSISNLTLLAIIENAPPEMAANTGLTLDEDGDAAFTSTELLVGVDPSTADTAAGVRLAITSVPEHGILWYDFDGDGIRDSDEKTFATPFVTDYANASTGTTSISSGRMHYEADPDYNGDDSFQMKLFDKDGGVNVVTIDITVNAVNDAPTLDSNAGLTLDEGAEATITTTDLAVGDIDNSASEITYTLDSAPQHGVLWVDANDNHIRDGGEALWYERPSFTQADIDAGRLHYSHDARENTGDSFQFDVSDGAGGAITTQSFAITVTPVDDAPTWDNNDALNVDEGGQSAISAGQLAFDDNDNTDSEITYTLDTTTAHGTLWIDADDDDVLDSGEALAAGNSFTQDDINNGRLHYTHDGGETTSDSFRFDVTDSAGGTVSDQSFDIDITPVSDAPTAEDHRVSLLEDSSYTLKVANFGFSDVDGDSLSQVIVTALPASGSLMLDGVAVEAGDAIDAADIAAGKLVYVPVADANGRGLASFTFQVVDDSGAVGHDTSTSHAITFDVVADPAEESEVNTYTAGDQSNHQVIALTDGGWVVTWTSDGQDGSSGGVYQQAYNADGTAKAEETRVNTYTADNQASPRITALAHGGWVVTWVSDGQDGDSVGVYQQAYNADGSASGLETRVNTTTAGVQATEQITGLTDGGWVVAWYSSEAGGANDSIFQQAYNADGTARGSEAQVNTYTGNDQYRPQITALADGGWVVVWMSNGLDTGYGLFQQAFNADGSALGAETHVNTYVTGLQDEQKVAALADGGWVVTWTSDGQGSYRDIHQQVYNADGTAKGVDTVVNHAIGYHISPEIAALADGGWVVTWQSGVGIRLQAYNADGTPQGDEIQANSGTAGSRKVPTITGLADGGWVVTWTAYPDDNNSRGVYQQAYNADGTTRGGEIQVNTHTHDIDLTQQVTALADGGWVVTWTPHGQDADVYQRRFDAEGQPYGTSHAPTAADVTLTTNEDASYAFSTGNFGFADAIDGDSLSTVIITALPASGTLKLDGVTVVAGASIDASDIAAGKLVYTPAADANGTGIASLSFKVVDDGDTEGGGFNTSSAHTISFNVTSVNDAPTAADATRTAIEDTLYNFSAADFGFADGDGDSLDHVTITALPTSGTLKLNGVAVTANQQIAAADLSSLVWTPAADAHGTGLASLTFKVTDDGGTAHSGSDTSASHTLTFNVTPVNDAPTAADATLTAIEDTAYTFSAADFGFSDGTDGSALDHVTITALPASGTLALNGTAVTVNQQIAAADLSSLVWTPAANANGAGDASLTFTVTDDGGTAHGGADTSAAHTLTFDVTAASDAPVTGDTTVSAFENEAYTFEIGNFPFADVDGDSLASVVITGLPASGTLKLDGVAVTADTTITAADIVAGKLVWTPPLGAIGNGLASLTFKVRDDGASGNGNVNLSDQHTLTFDIGAVNHAPTAQDATLTVLENHGLTFELSDFGFADADSDSLSNILVTSAPASGTLTLNGVDVGAGDSVSVADIAAGKLIWTPAAGAEGSGLASLSFKVQDDGGTAHGGSDTSLAHTLTFDVISVNHAPTAQDATLTVLEDHSLTIRVGDLGFADADNSNLANVYITSLPASGTLKLNGQAVMVNTAIAAADIAAGKLVWTPPANGNGNGLTSLSFKVQDDGGTENGGSDTSAAHTLTFNVTSVNDAPVVDFNSASTFEDEAVTMNVLAGAVDLDGDTLTITAASVTSGFGSVSVIGGKLVYDPTTAPNQNIGAGESREVKVNYTVSDGHGENVTETITITVSGVSPDVFKGTDAGETLTGSNGSDILYGLGGNDLLDGGAGADDMRGGKGNDVYIVEQSKDRVSEGKHAGIDLVKASVSFTLGNNIEKLQLTGAADIDADGNALANTLTGNKADNRLWGGLGADRLSGGKGADAFLFHDIAESTAKAGGRDVIIDFSRRQHDQIDLHLIDANEAKNGNQSFKFIGADHFDGHAGELRLMSGSGHTLIQADIDGDRRADFAILLDGITTLKEGDFLL